MLPNRNGQSQYKKYLTSNLRKKPNSIVNCATNNKVLSSQFGKTYFM